MEAARRRGSGVAEVEVRAWCGGAGAVAWERCGSARAMVRRAACGRRNAYFFETGASPLVVEPAVMFPSITIELNPTPPKLTVMETGGDGALE